jgi:hypothetical protein
MVSDLTGAVPRSGRIQSSIEPALVKLHELYVSSGTQVGTTQPFGSPTVSSKSPFPAATPQPFKTSIALLDSEDIPTGVVWWWIVMGGVLALAILSGVRIASSGDRFRSTAGGKSADQAVSPGSSIG